MSMTVTKARCQDQRGAKSSRPGQVCGPRKSFGKRTQKRLPEAFKATRRKQAQKWIGGEPVLGAAENRCVG